MGRQSSGLGCGRGTCARNGRSNERNHEHDGEDETWTFEHCRSHALLRASLIPSGRAESATVPAVDDSDMNRPPPLPAATLCRVPRIPADQPPASDAIAAIRAGDVETLRRLLEEEPALVTARIVRPGGHTLTLLHVACDWPGHFPNGAETVRTLLAAGADVDSRYEGPHNQTPLHWAASSDDVEVLDALLEGGADIEAPGAFDNVEVRSTTRSASGNGMRRGASSSAARTSSSGTPLRSV